MHGCDRKKRKAQRMVVGEGDWERRGGCRQVVSTATVVPSRRHAGGTLGAPRRIKHLRLGASHL
jgi:hypothetical protein